MTSRYWSPRAWHDLTHFLVWHCKVREQSGIKPFPAAGEVGWDELTVVLGGDFDVWPEWARRD